MLIHIDKKERIQTIFPIVVLFNRLSMKAVIFDTLLCNVETNLGRLYDLLGFLTVGKLSRSSPPNFYWFQDVRFVRYKKDIASPIKRKCSYNERHKVYKNY